MHLLAILLFIQIICKIINKHSKDLLEVKAKTTILKLNNGKYNMSYLSDEFID